MQVGRRFHRTAVTRIRARRWRFVALRTAIDAGSAAILFRPPTPRYWRRAPLVPKTASRDRIAPAREASLVTGAAPSRTERHEHFYWSVTSHPRFHLAWTRVCQAAALGHRPAGPVTPLIVMRHRVDRGGASRPALAEPRGAATVFRRSIDWIVQRVVLESGRPTASQSRELGAPAPARAMSGRPAFAELELSGGLRREVGSTAEIYASPGIGPSRRPAARGPQRTPALASNGAEALPGSAAPTLVWRRPATRAEDGESVLPARKSSQPSSPANESIGPHALGHPSTPSSERGADALSAAAAAGRPSPTISLPFDNGTLDRLAADVMKRIDKRIRVERERRGR